MRALDRRLLRRARSLRLALGVDVALGLTSAGLLIAQAVLIAALVAGTFDGRPFDRQLGLLGALAVTVAVRAALAGAVEAIGRWAAAGVISELRRALVHGLLGGRGGAVQERGQSAELATDAVGGVDALEVYLARYLPQIVLATVVPVAVLVTALVVDPTSAAVLLVTLPVVPVFMALVGRFTADRARERWQALARLSNHVLDVLSGLPTLRAYNRAEAQAARIADTGEEYRRTTMQVLRLSFLSGAVLDLAATIATALVAVTVGVRMIGGHVDLRAGLTVLLLTPELYAPLRTLGTLFHASADGLAVAERLLDALEPAGAPAPAVEGLPGPSDWRRVTLTGVTVAPPGRGRAVLEDFDLDLRRGEVVALVGPSGSGKSTVAALVLGLRHPDRGRVRVDGRDLATIDQQWWHREVGWLPQRPTMFRGTIWDNISLGDPSASPARIEGAAALAGVTAFVSQLRLGYATPIGPGGRGLSAGEQRRVGLARALVRGAPLLVLDEPTANLDADAAGVVADAVARVARGRAVLVIEHRPELLPAVTRTVTLAPAEVGEDEDARRVPAAAS